MVSDDTGILNTCTLPMMVSNNLQLKFCLSGNIYGEQRQLIPDRRDDLDVLSEFSFRHLGPTTVCKTNKTLLPSLIVYWLFLLLKFLARFTAMW
jgi:hypothetical protein